MCSRKGWSTDRGRVGQVRLADWRDQVMRASWVRSLDFTLAGDAAGHLQTPAESRPALPQLPGMLAGHCPLAKEVALLYERCTANAWLIQECKDPVSSLPF